MSRSKKIMALFLSIVMVLGLLPASAFAANDTSAFSDVKTSAWYHEDVQYVSENGLMKGTGENLFSPDATTTRGMIVTILYRLEGEPSPTGACPFQDVASGKYYEKAITWAAENGIVSGFSADTFGPDQNITREQMAAILYRYATYKKYDVSTAGDLSKFPDADKVSSYAVDAMKWANAAGLINGSNDGKLYPAGNATRAQVAAILTRFCKNIAAQCTVTFQLNYGSEGTYTTLKVAKGDTITAPKAPTRSGYTFSSWSEKTSGSAFDFKTPIEKDITLYAQWNKKSSGSSGGGTYVPPATYTVSFDSTGGSPVDSQTINKSDRITRPENPEKDGYVFAGWYMSREYSQEFDFYNTNISGDTVLYARWVDATDTTDSDRDGLTDAVEEYFVTDPLKQDTDGDGLSDYFEIAHSQTDPLVMDTDGNGVMDGAEDPDGDKLTNLEEQAKGSDPLMADSDLDGLSDFDEVKCHNTDPAKSDSDNDGADDGWELKHGYDPTVYNSSFSVAIQPLQPSHENPVTAGVNLTSGGESASSVNISKVDNNPLISKSIAGYLGDAFEFTTTGPIDKAELTFTYDASLGTEGDSFKPRIYYFNEETGLLEELPNQVVTDGEVKAQVSHFSTYVLLNKVAVDKVWATDIKTPQNQGDSQYTGIDVVFVIDSSGSMWDNDRSGLRKEAAKAFVDKLGSNDRAAVIDFDHDASVYQDFTSDHTNLKNAINRIDNSGGTDLGAGMGKAISLFTNSSYTRTDAYKYIIFLTDGDGSYNTGYTSTASKNGIVVYTVGLGSGVKESTLKAIADGTGGKYYFASTADALSGIYKDVSFETVDYTTDTNNDGISDYYTKLLNDGDLVLSTGCYDLVGVIETYGKNCDDWDGDGLKNGDELKIVQQDGKVYLKMLSSPIEYDTDGDGLNDRSDTHPLEWDVCNRDLAMCAALCYEDGTEARNAGRFYRVDEINGDRNGGEPGESYYFYGFAHVNEMESWKVVDYSKDNRILKYDNFCATTYKNGNNIIIAYRGTDEDLEWVDNVVRYGLMNHHREEQQARAYAKKIVQLYPDCSIYITGHSLGGYLAQIGTAELVQRRMDGNLKRVAYFNGIGVAFNMKLEILTQGKALDKIALYNYSHDGLHTSNHKLVSYAIRGDWVHNLGSHQGDKVEYYAAKKCIAHHKSLMSAEYEGLSFWQAFKKAFGSSIIDVAGLALSSVAASPDTIYYYNYYGVPDFIRFTWITHETDSFFAQNDFTQGTRNLI